MTTFFLTAKAFKSFKMPVQSPPQIIPSFDGWYIDLFTLNRKKVILATHEHSYLSFAAYLTELGGATKVPNWLVNEIASFMKRHCSSSHDRILELLNRPSSFHKTNSRKVIGHMTDFKNFIHNSVLTSNEVDDWQKISLCLHGVPVGPAESKYANPKEIFLSIIAGDK